MPRTHPKFCRFQPISTVYTKMNVTAIPKHGAPPLQLRVLYLGAGRAAGRP
jgi:hypothetical protein